MSRSKRRTLNNPRALEDYLRASDPPRWMTRLSEIDQGVKQTRRALEQAYLELRERCGEDREAFAAAWRERLASWRWDAETNLLIQQHNDWYPVERSLPIDLKTRDYRLVNGKSYRRAPLDAKWALEEFPAELG